MACEYPMMAFDTGVKSETGKRVFKYARPGTTALSLDGRNNQNLVVMPSKIHLVDGHHFLLDPIPIPCGSCSACLMDYASELSTRAVLESQYWKNSYFITLTYSDRCLPISKFTGQAILIKKELQNFLDRLRKYISYRYVACGEYGDLTARPHFHAIIFTDEDLDLKLVGSLPDERPTINVYHCSLLYKLWKFGMHEVSKADTGTIKYVCGYVLKKCKMIAENDPHRPFRLTSRHPGLGFKYLEDHDVLKDGCVYGDFGENKKTAPIPSAFIRKLESNGVDVEAFKDDRKSNGERFNDIMKCWYGTSDIDELGGARRMVLKSKIENYRKEKI